MICSFAVLSNNKVAAAIGRPARTGCLRGHREKKRSSVARVSTVGAWGSKRAEFLKNEYQVRTPCVSSKTYTWLQCKKRQIQAPGTTVLLSATRSASKEGTETADDLPHSRECTKESISATSNYGSKEKFGARAERQEKLRGRGGSSCRLKCLQSFGGGGNATQMVISQKKFTLFPKNEPLTIMSS